MGLKRSAKKVKLLRFVKTLRISQGFFALKKSSQLNLQRSLGFVLERLVHHEAHKDTIHLSVHSVTSQPNVSASLLTSGAREFEGSLVYLAAI